MPAAVIDLGTNSFNLLLPPGTEQGTPRVIKEPVMLGQGGIHQRQISDKARQRALATLKKFKTTTRHCGAQYLYAIGTSALRDAHNADELCRQARSELDIHINIISGHEEAQLIYRGVRSGLSLAPGPCLIMDIGGGSVEFIMAEGEKIYWLESFDLGSTRLRERFSPSDPMTTTDIQRILSFAEKALEPLREMLQKYRVQRLVGSSGSFETLAVLTCNTAKGYSFGTEPDNGYIFDPEALAAVIERLRQSTRQQRLQWPGLHPMRVDTLPLATLLASIVRQWLPVPWQLSNFALKEGVMETLTLNQHSWQKSLL